MTVYKLIHTLNRRTTFLHYDPAIEKAWGKLWGFRIKHPDSTRTHRAKELGKMRKYVGRKWEVEG